LDSDIKFKDIIPKQRQIVLCHLCRCDTPHSLPHRKRTNTRVRWILAHRKLPNWWNSEFCTDYPVKRATLFSDLNHWKW